MNAPRFSVVVPAHNEADVLGRTLGSLRAQDFPGAVEVVVVDNGSVDGTADLARAAGVRVAQEPILGVCAARQRGTDAGSRADRRLHGCRHGAPTRLAEQDRRGLPRRPRPRGRGGPVPVRGPTGVGGRPPRLGFAVVAAAHRLTGWVGYVTATNVAFRREGFPGYDTSLTQGGDEVDLLRRLRRQGRVTWDRANAVRTSSRRLDQGLAHTAARVVRLLLRRRARREPAGPAAGGRRRAPDPAR